MLMSTHRTLRLAYLIKQKEVLDWKGRKLLPKRDITGHPFEFVLECPISAAWVLCWLSTQGSILPSLLFSR